MSATEDFVNQCLDAVAEDRGASAIKEIVERAVRDANLANELFDQPGLRRLYHSDTLTVAHVAIPKRRADAPPPVAHDHRMWAVIGMIRGGEDNAFFRRSGQTIVSSGGRVAVQGDVVGCTNPIVLETSGFVSRDGALSGPERGRRTPGLASAPVPGESREVSGRHLS